MKNIDEKTYFTLKQHVEQFSPQSFESIKDAVSKDNRTLFSIIQLLSAINKPYSLLDYEPLINFLLKDEKLIGDVFRIVFTKDNLNHENIIMLNRILRGDVYGKILEFNDKSNFYITIKIALSACKDDDRRFLVIDSENHSMLDIINTSSDIFTPFIENKIYVINANSEHAYFNAFKRNDRAADKRELYDLWLMSFVCRESLYTRTMGILHHEYESLKSESSGEDYDKPFTYYADHTTSLLRDFYDTFKEKSNYDKLDEIASFCLLYFNLEQSAYSRRYLIAANDDIYHILIEFLMLNPELNLDVIINEHKKLRYQNAWKLTIPYNGTELSGSGFSRTGSAFTLHDSPIVERVLTPFFKRLYEEDCKKPRHKNRFTKIVENKIFGNLETSAHNPIYLKRAAIQSLLIGLLTEIPKKKHLYKRMLIFAINKTEGLPRCNEVVFSQLMYLSDYINKCSENYDYVFDLIVEDMKLYGTGLPTNVFTIQAILFLIKNKYVKAERLFIKLLDNPDYIKRDDWDYHTLANLGNYRDYKSSFILKVIKSFISNQDWLSIGKGWSINEVIPYLVELYLSTGDEAQQVHKEIIAIANANTKTEALDNLCAYFLRSLAEKKPEKAYSILKEMLDESKPWEIFRYGRDSLVSIADHLIEKTISINNQEVKKDLLDKACEIIEQFIVDPEPSNEDNGPGYSYHTKILNDEDTVIIATVRGHVCWAVQKLCFHDYSLGKAWEYTNRLLKDKNLYVVYQALVPFIEIVKRRSKLSDQERVAIDATIEYCLDKYSQYKPLANHLGVVCSFYRDIDEAKAAKFVEKLKNSENFGFFAVYFAYFREDQYPERGAFDSSKFKSQIISLIKEHKEPELVKKIFNQLNRVVDENIDFLPRIIDVINAYKHNSDLDKSILHSVYRIVNQVVEKDKNRNYSKAILDIYKRYLRIEREFIEASLKLKEVNRFLIDYSHKEILEALYEISKDYYYACTSEIMEIAITKNLYIDHYSIAQTLSNERDPALIPKAIELLDKLTTLNPKYYEFKGQLESLLRHD